MYFYVHIPIVLNVKFYISIPFSASMKAEITMELMKEDSTYGSDSMYLVHTPMVLNTFLGISTRFPISMQREIISYPPTLLQLTSHFQELKYLSFPLTNNPPFSSLAPRATCFALFQMHRDRSSSVGFNFLALAPKISKLPLQITAQSEYLLLAVLLLRDFLLLESR